jgi:protocatechuate 3,4-dioxygenase beta subunit/thiol-disulfide isomerase/thioredoxin
MLLLSILNSIAFAAITGKVQTTDGKPIAEAKVICRLYEGKGKERKFVTQTDGRGQFTFPEIVIQPESYGASLLVVAKGYGVGGCYIRSNNPKIQFSPETLPPDKPVTITLFPEATIEFRLIDENGKPVQGAKVVVEIVSPPRTQSANFFEQNYPVWLHIDRDAEELGLTAISDTDGLVRLQNLPVRSKVQIYAEHERFGKVKLRPSIGQGFLPHEFEISTEPLNIFPDIVLEEPGEAEGEVRYEDGRPAAGIRLFYREDDYGAQGEVTTDEQGRYCLTRLVPGLYTLSLHHELRDKLDWVAMPPILPFTIRSGQKTSVPTLTLCKGGFLEGIARDAETGQPVTDVVISVGQIIKHADVSALYWVAQAKTDTQGHYRVQVPPGEFECYIGVPSGYLPPVSLSPIRPNPYKGVIKAGETVRMDIQLRKGLIVRGQVVDEQGKPVAEAVVLNMEGDFDPQLIVTDEKGIFTLTNLPPLKPIRLRAYKNELRNKEDVVVFPDELKAKNIVLRLAKIPPPKVVGRVVDESGKPISGATVSVGYPRRHEGGVSITEKPMTVTDEQGRFEILGLWHSDNHFVVVRANGYAEWKSNSFILRIGEVRKLETITLKRAGAVIVGTVLGEEGPIQGVTVYTLNGNMVATRTDRKGRFELKGLAPGRQSLVVREATKYGWLNLEVEVGTEKDALKILSVDPVRANVRKVEVRNGELYIFLLPLTTPTEAENKRSQSELEMRPPEIGKIAPDLSVQTWFNSKPLSLSTLRGKIVVLDFCDWFGCGPCLQELPSVVRLAQKFSKQGLVVISIHSPNWESKRLGQLIKERKLSHPIAIDRPTKQFVGETMMRYGVHILPTYAVIDRQGILQYLGSNLTDVLTCVEKLLKR